VKKENCRVDIGYRRDNIKPDPHPSTAAFNHICEFMSHMCSLTILFPTDEVCVVTDASVLGIGGVLQVKRNGAWKTAAYYSRQTSACERKYSATELEALAVMATVKHFSYYLYNRPFCVYTDHKALCSLLKTEMNNSRLRRFGSLLNFSPG